MNTTELVTPNWHVILIHYPLGLLSVGIIIEILGFLWKRSSARTAGRWMILLGALALIPAATSGMYAYRQALVKAGEYPGTWHEIVQQNRFTSPVQWELFHRHMLFNGWGTGAMAFAALVFLGSSDRWRRTLYIPLLLILLGGYGLLVSGAWHGGEGVYRYGTGVEGPKGVVLQVDARPVVAKVERAVQPIQLHVFLAGVTVALALAALGLSLRGLTEGDQVDETWYQMQQARRLEEQPRPHNDPIPPGHEPYPMDDPPPRRSGVVSKVTVMTPAPTASARWWLLGALVAIGTAAAGLWFANILKWQTLRDEFKNSWQTPNFHRMAAHASLGAGIIVLALLMALIGRVARKSKLLFAFFALLTLAVIGSQVWVGTLLLYDGAGEGSLKVMDAGMPAAAPTPTPPPATRPAGAVARAG